MQKNINLSGAESAPDNTKIFDSKAYKRSRKAYMAQCTIEYFVSILVADAFLAKAAYIHRHKRFPDRNNIIVYIACLYVPDFSHTACKAYEKHKENGFDIRHIEPDIFHEHIYNSVYAAFNNIQTTVLVIVSVLVAYFAKYLIYSIFFGNRPTHMSNRRHPANIRRSKK